MLFSRDVIHMRLGRSYKLLVRVEKGVVMFHVVLISLLSIAEKGCAIATNPSRCKAIISFVSCPSYTCTMAQVLSSHLPV